MLEDELGIAEVSSVLAEVFRIEFFMLGIPNTIEITRAVPNIPERNGIKKDLPKLELFFAGSSKLLKYHYFLSLI